MHLCEESGVHQVFMDHKFYYPVKITIENKAPLVDFPWLKPSDFIKALHKTNDLSHLLGGKSWADSKEALVSFWQKYAGAYPNHQLWEHVRNTNKDLSKCIPLFLHGDEGTSFKRQGILVLSMQGALGSGTSKSDSSQQTLPLNFLGSGLRTRLLICVCPKDCMDLRWFMTDFIYLMMYSPVAQVAFINSFFRGFFRGFFYIAGLAFAPPGTLQRRSESMERHFSNGVGRPFKM